MEMSTNNFTVLLIICVVCFRACSGNLFYNQYVGSHGVGFECGDSGGPVSRRETHPLVVGGVDGRRVILRIERIVGRSHTVRLSGAPEFDKVASGSAAAVGQVVPFEIGKVNLHKIFGSGIVGFVGGPIRKRAVHGA